MQKGFAPIFILVGILVITAVVGGGYYFLKLKTPEPKVCTMDVKTCLDGSSVGRIGPNCEFAACSSLKPSPTSLLPLVTENNETLTPEEQKKILPLDETANWKTYINNKYKYSVKYPNNWQILESKQFPDFVVFYPPEADMQLITKVDNGLGTPQEGMDSLRWPSMDISVRPRPFSESPLGNKEPSIKDWKVVVVDGIEGHFYKTHECAPKCGVYVDLPFENGQKTLSISASDDSDINTFQQFFPTFQFLK